MLSQAYISVPSREQSGVPESRAPTNQIGLGKGLCDLAPMLWKKLRMSLHHVELPRLGEFDLAIQFVPGAVTLVTLQKALPSITARRAMTMSLPAQVICQLQ